MNKLFKLAASAAIFVSTAAGALAADHNLTIAGWAPPTHGFNAIMLPTLISWMEEATDGKVTGEIKYGLAPPPALMDLVQDGAADMAIIFHGYQAGRFVGTKLIELPGYVGNAEDASVAYWRVHDKHLAPLDEHKGVKLVALHTHGPGQLHTNADVNSLADMDGLKTRIPGGVANDVGTELGLVGIQVPAPKVYETLASGAADAVTMPVESRKGFKLNEVAKNVFEMPGGLYRGSFALIMNQETFDNLPDDIKEALENDVFGERTSRMFGQTWDQMDKEGMEVTMAAEDNSVRPASDADIAAYKVIADKVTASVLAELSEMGVDANAAHEMVQSEMSGN